MLHPQVHRIISRKAFLIKETGANAVAIQDVDMKNRVHPTIGDAGGGSVKLLLVEADAFLVYRGQLISIKLELARHDSFRPGIASREIKKGGKRPFDVVRR